MKKTYIIIFLVLLASASIAQTIRRVNANPAVTGTNVYQSLQAAHDAATTGDIIIVEASAVSCGDLTSTKGLKIYGKGYFTDANSDLNVSPNPSQAGNIIFNVGSDNSELSGVSCVTLKVAGASNVRIFRNRVSGRVDILAENLLGTDIAISNIQVAQNYFENNLYVTSTLSGIFTIQVTNNYLYTITSSTTNITGLEVNNNVIDYQVSIANAAFKNNILTYNSTCCFGAPGSSVTNNIALMSRISALALDASGNQNLTLATLNAELLVTIGAALPVGTSQDERWQLKAASALKTAGTSGSEVGMYGGPNPYVPSGIPSAPSILKLLTPDYGNTASPLPVTISVKSNN